jgi:uncharacterized protein Yka (UPF0111/DUF47 family)
MRLIPRRPLDHQLMAMYVEAGRNSHRAAELLCEMLAEHPDRQDLARDVLLCEQDGDRVTHDVIHRLNARHTGRRPFSVEDGHALASALDDIVDATEQTADSLCLYAIEAPMEQAERLADVLVEATREVEHALELLAGEDEVTASLVEIHRLENEGDRLLRDGLAALFTGGIDPMLVIRWKDLLGSLEQAVDACETTAHVLEGIMLKRR